METAVSTPYFEAEMLSVKIDKQDFDEMEYKEADWIQRFFSIKHGAWFIKRIDPGVDKKSYAFDLVDGSKKCFWPPDKILVEKNVI